MKKSPPFNQNMVIRGAIRRTFPRSPVYREVLYAGRREVPKYNKDGSRAKKDAVQYHCEVCLDWVSSTKIAVDHIVPVISVDNGFVDWNEFVARLYCSKENLQRICDDCHQKKTNKERFERNFKQELEQISALEKSANMNVVKAGLKKFTKKKLGSSPYPQDFIDRVERLRASIKKK